MKSVFPYRRKVNTPLPWRGRENGGPQRETKERERRGWKDRAMRVYMSLRASFTSHGGTGISHLLIL